jgi:hypothetical protein
MTMIKVNGEIFESKTQLWTTTLTTREDVNDATNITEKGFKNEREKESATKALCVDAPRSCTTRPQTTTAFFARRKSFDERVGCWGMASSSSLF